MHFKMILFLISMTLFIFVDKLDTADANCKDDNPACPAWASNGECKSNPIYMLVSCKKSCNMCNKEFPVEYLPISERFRRIYKELDERNIDPRVCPMQYKPVDINTAMSLKQLLDVDTAKGRLQIAGEITVNYKYPNLCWSAEYGIAGIPRNSSKLWVPTLYITESVNKKNFKITQFLGIRCSPEKVSTIIARQVETFTTTCNFNVFHFPFDSHKCDVTIMLSQTSDQARFVYSHKNSQSLFGSQHNSEWHIIEATVDVVEENITVGDLLMKYSFLKVKIAIKRNYQSYVASVFVPGILLAIISFVIFIVPSENIAKIGFGVSILLAYTMYQLLLFNTLPKTKHVPHLSIITGFLQSMCALSVFASALILRVYRLDIQKHPIPNWLIKLKSPRKVIVDMNMDEEMESASVQIPLSWQDIARDLDNIGLAVNVVAHVVFLLCVCVPLCSYKTLS